MTINRQIVLAELPKAKLEPGHFRLTSDDAPRPGDGEVLVRTRYVALDAANRAWMMGATYRAGLSAGQVMAGASLVEVVESRAEGLWPGDLAYTDHVGWQDYGILTAAQLRTVAPTERLSDLLNVYGVAGLTAYFGLLDCGQPKAGETVVVSAAAGAVGLIVGQIAKIKGCRVVGIAGGAAKCALLTDEFGFDAAVDYKSHEGMALYGALQAACGGGIDVYFDNVGGQILDVCLFSMNTFGRVAACGAVSMYDGGAPPYGVRAMAGIVSKRVNIRGFIVSDFYDRRDAALADLKSWVSSGQLKVREDVIDGLEALPDALIGLLAGDNIGKRMVKVA